MGHNGAGKTTLLRAAVGLLPVKHGHGAARRRGRHQAAPERTGTARPRLRPAGPAVLPADDHAGEPAAGHHRARPTIDEVLDTFPALTGPAAAACRAAVRRPAPAALDRPHPAHQAADADPRRADRGHPAQRRRRDRAGDRRRSPRRGDLSVLLVEQHVGFALRVDRPLLRPRVRPDHLAAATAAPAPSTPSARRWRSEAMHLTPADTEKLLLAVAGMVARDRLARGVRLNYPETVALLTTWVIERARDGRRRRRPDDHGPRGARPRPGHARRRRDAHRRPGRGDLPRRPQARHPPPADRLSEATSHGQPQSSGPGAIRVAAGTARAQRRPHAPTSGARLVIVNTGDRPVQIGSHIHLPDVNAALDFDREAADGFRLDIPSGTSRRFEPGASREVDDRRAARRGASCPGLQVRRRHDRWLRCSSRGEYAALYGPTDRATRCASATPTCGSRSSRT